MKFSKLYDEKIGSYYLQNVFLNLQKKIWMWSQLGVKIFDVEIHTFGQFMEGAISIGCLQCTAVHCHNLHWHNLESIQSVWNFKYLAYPPWPNLDSKSHVQYMFNWFDMDLSQLFNSESSIIWGNLSKNCLQPKKHKLAKKWVSHELIITLPCVCMKTFWLMKCNGNDLRPINTIIGKNVEMFSSS